jgi:hypothetical protein
MVSLLRTEARTRIFFIFQTIGVKRRYFLTTARFLQVQSLHFVNSASLLASVYATLYFGSHTVAVPYVVCRMPSLPSLCPFVLFFCFVFCFFAAAAAASLLCHLHHPSLQGMASMLASSFELIVTCF